MAGTPGTFRFPQVNSKPSAPPLGYDLIYVRTDDVLYIQDSTGVEVALGSASSITQLTGDVTATGPGSAAATVNSVGTSSAANIHSAELLANAATALNTASTIVKRDGSGNFAAGTITANLTGNVTGNATTATTATNFSGSLSGDVTGTQSATVVSFVGTSSAANVHSAELLANAATALNTASTIVKRDASGNFAAGTITASLSGNATTATTTTNFSGSLSGDVTGTQSATVVSLVGGKSAASVATSVNDTQAATSVNTPSTIVKRDGSGNFAAGTITANLTGNVTGNVSGTAANVTGIVAIANGGTGQSTASAAFAALSPLTTAGDIIYENSTPAPARLPIGSTGQILTVVAGLPSWSSPATSGTVTSVALLDGSTTPIYSISGSPVTSSGTLEFTLNTQTANTFFAGPSTGSPAQPTFRAVVPSDIPTLNQNTTGTASNITASSNSTLTTLSSLSLPGAQVTGNISGNAANVTGIVAIAHGGTGQATQQLAINALAGAVTSGEFLRGDGTNVVMSNIQVSDVPTLNQNTTGTASNITATSNSTLTTLSSLALPTSQLTGTIVLTTQVSGILPISHGGTNSSTALNNNRIMQSSGGAIVEAAAITANRALISDVNGIPTQSVTTATELGFVSGVTSSIQTQLNSISGSAITALSGDVSATGPGSVAATVNSVGGSSAANIHSAELLANAATSVNTPSTIVKRDGSGNFAAGTITANLTGNVTGNVSGSSASFTGSLSGDVTGTQSATVVSLVGGKSAASVATSVNDTQAATALNTASTIVKRDASGNFAAGTITANITGNVSGSSASFTGSLAGDVAGTQSATVIQPNVVTNAKLAQMPTLTLKGNNTGGTANALDLTVSQVNTMLGTITTIGAIDSQTAQANGLDIVGNTLYAQSASTSNPGMVNNTTQSFSGNKTFTGTVAVTPSSTTALTINTTSFVFDSTNNALGIGIQPGTNTFIDAVNTSLASKTLQLTGYGVGSTVGTRGRFARGTSGTPAAAQNADVLNFWSARGYGTSQFATTSTAAINAVAGETFTNTSNLTYLTFLTTPTGSVTSAESMRVASTGVTLGPQSSSTAINQFNGGLNVTTRTITANLTIDTTTTDYIIYCNNSGAITVTLPAPTNGRTITLKDIAGTANTNNITLARHASEKIEGIATSRTLQTNWGQWTFTSDGTDWYMA